MIKKNNIKVVDSMNEFFKLSENWNRLLFESSSNTIFLTWEWLYSWSECFLNENRKLFILAVYENDELIGIAPWYINHIKIGPFKIKQIEFLGSPEAGSDYLDVISKKRKEKEVALSIYEFLYNEGNGRWHFLKLNDMPANSFFLLHFLCKVEEDGKYIEVKEGSFCPILFIEEGKDSELFSNISSPRRKKKLKYEMNILKKLGDIKYKVFFEENIERALNDYISFYEEKGEYSIEPLKKHLLKFLCMANAKKWMQIDFLTLDGKNIAAFLHFRYGGRLYLYLIVVDKTINPKISIGNIMIGLCTENAYKNQIFFYDFLKGAENYKFFWANSGQRSLNIFFCKRELIPILISWGKLIKYGLKLFLR